MRYVYLLERDTVNGTVQRLEHAKPTKRKPGKPRDTDADRAWRMSFGLYKDGLSPYGWDSPTFKIQSERLF